ncbi:MAG TPA: twin-arginine translocation signal domain-containing protein, partial [Blastocatellia bacterium]|nr:twin-arginine translocation signal domain-containing protein [Blastocatellia bacterium]
MEKKNSVSAEHLAKSEVSNKIIEDAAHRAEPKPSSRSRRRFMGTVTAGVAALPPLLASITGEARAQEVEPLSDIGPVSG